MEKKKTTAAEYSTDNDKQFLDKSGATDQIRDVLAKVLENRPEDPVTFLSNYFEALGDKVDRTSKAVQQIGLTHHSKPAFQNNLLIAYDILSYNKVTERKLKSLKRELGSKQTKGVTGASYNDLIKELSSDFPVSVRDKLLLKIKCRDYEVILFDIFRSGVFTCLVLKDYLGQAEGLFKTLEETAANKVERLLCETILKLLQESIKSTKKSSNSVLDTGYMLGPDRLYSGIATTMFKSTAPKSTMGLDEFLASAADSFLSKVSTLQ